MVSAVTIFPDMSILSISTGTADSLYLIALFQTCLRYDYAACVARMSRYDIRIAPVFLNGTTLCLAVHTDYLSVSASIKQFVMEVVGYFVQAY